MTPHLENLLIHYPELINSKVLDIGSGRGKFLIELSKLGVKSVGVEMNQDYISRAYEAALTQGLKINIVKSEAENLPFPDEEFDFINMAEVIEHVKTPEKVLLEMKRVLKIQGKSYLSVPNRFSLKDPHFNLYFVNWLPRSCSEFYIYILGRQKSCTGKAGYQRIKEMHYYTFSAISKLLDKSGFSFIDARESKITRRIKNPMIAMFVLLFYKLFRSFYFDSFHLILSNK